MNNLIGIVGVAGSGKSTVARMLNKELGGHYQIKHFADPIKDTLSLYFGVTREQIEDRKFKENNIPGWEITPRDFMEGLGESMRETFGHDFWVRLIMSDYKPVQKGQVWEGEDMGAPYLHKSCRRCGKQYNGHKHQYQCKECSEIIEYPSWILADMRKPVEADAVKSYGGYIVKVINPRVKPRGLASENLIEQIEPDYIIYNDSSFFDLEFKVKKMVEKMKTK